MYHPPCRLEVAPLVKGVSNAIHQSFLTRDEAARMFAEEQARGRTRTVDPEHDTVTIQPLERNYSAPTPMTPTGKHPTGHHHRRSPPSLSVDPTTPSSRNRTDDSTLSSILQSSDLRPPINTIPSSTSRLHPAGPTTTSGSPISTWDVSPSMRRLQLIQAALDEDLGSRSQDLNPIASAGRKGYNADTSSLRSLTPRAGPSSSSGTRPLQRAVTASPNHFRANPKTYLSSRTLESAPAPVRFDARASHGQSSRTNINPSKTAGGARTSNPSFVSMAASSSRPSSSRGSQRTSPHATARLAASDSSYARPRAVIRTPEWISPYPTARTPSPDPDLSPESRSSSASPADALLSPLSNMNLNSLDHPFEESSSRNIPSPTTNSSTRRPTPRRVNLLSPSVVSQSTFTHGASTESAIRLDARIRRIEISHNFDPRSPILDQQRVPELAYERCFLCCIIFLGNGFFSKMSRFQCP